jgi:hypothetical protein
VKGVVHSFVRDLPFLGNFSHGIAFISQNENRLTSFRRKFFVSCHFEPVIEPTNADAPDTQLASFIPSLLRTTVFSCVNIFEKGFSNDQLAF